MVSAVKIRQRLLLGFGYYIVIALALGVLAYREVREITARLAVVEAADDLVNTLLEVRRYEKNYLLYQDEQSARDLRRYLGELHGAIERIRARTGAEIGAGHFARMNAALAQYEGAFNDLVDARKRRKEQAGEEPLLERMRSKARDVQSLAELLAATERTAINGLLERAGRSLRILLGAMIAAIAVGVVVNRRLSASIAAPLAELEGLTKKIAAGDFSQRIAVSGNDELASLAGSFNLMQERVHDTLTALERTNAELHENRAQLVEAEKLATLGRFSVGVAHEINNPLAIINEKAGLMQDYLERAEDFREKERFSGLLAAIFASVQRCRSITHRILAFAGQPGDSPDAVDLNALVREVLPLVEEQVERKGVRVTLNLQEQLPLVKSDRTQIQQVLASILLNAVEAVGAGGAIRVATARKQDGTLQVSIADNGRGIPGDVLQHIFEPFLLASTQTGAGAGLGLSISYGIIRRLGGTILVSSEPDKGTVVTVELPG
jgi:C4-dicarboxylate-specific signal transduction histidine kinase